MHVRDYGLQSAEDEVVFDRAAEEGRILVSADTDFGMLLALRKAKKPTAILFHRTPGRRPKAQLSLLLANLPMMAEALEQGSAVVLDDLRVRIRAHPVTRPAPGRGRHVPLPRPPTSDP